MVNSSASSSNASLDLSVTVTTGDVIFIQNYTSWTAGATTVQGVSIGYSGVTGSWLSGVTGNGVWTQYNVTSSLFCKCSLFGIFIASSSGTCTFTSLIGGLASAISNAIGYGFLKKQ
jgi:hypothetical protein